MKFNQEQEKAILCDENAVVAAGAGSGKTLVLANRFIRLLTEKGYNIDEILTLTFTKKAAAQMYGRIYSLISEIAKSGASLQAQRAQHALDNFIHARIQTLDSYGTSLVKLCANRYGISPNFTINNDRCRKLSLEVSYPFLLSHRNHPAIEQLYINKRPINIASDIADVLYKYCTVGKLHNFISYIENQFNIICAQWEPLCNQFLSCINNLENCQSDWETLYKDIIPVMEKYKNDKIEIPSSKVIRGYFNELLKENSTQYIMKAESHELQKTLKNLLYFLNLITSLNLQKGKRANNTVKIIIKEIREIKGAFSSLFIFCMQAGFNLSFASLLTELQDEYITKKRREGIMTFKDVANLSKTILIEQKDIRQAEKESFKAIMIDEFQDNNDLQKDILFLLAEKLDVLSDGIPQKSDICKDKLFFVGDEKQSIYLFRGADVSVFRKLKDELNALDIPLSYNYRSSAVLINAFNALFPLVFAPPQSLVHYEAEYNPLKAGKDLTKGKISISIFNKTEQDEDDDLLKAEESEARYIAEKIQSLLSESKYKPHEIAILFRTRTNQHFCEKHLRFLGIPYSCEDINDLFFAGPVNDILSVLRLAAYPIDSASYAEMLRSPFAGLSICGTALCLSLYLEGSNNPFDDLPLNHLDESDKIKYTNGKNIYLKIKEKAESESISSLVSDLWHNLGYRYETEWNAEVSVYRELFDYLYHLAVLADSENQTLASFTDSLFEYRDYEERLTEIELPLERQSAVHLMTIHKSKGLEFPVVFISNCGNRSKPDTDEFVYYSDEAGIVFSAPVPPAYRNILGNQNNFFQQRVKEEKKRKRTAELRRVLYVAMTRAEKELYLTGSINLPDDETDDIYQKLINYVEEKSEKNENYIDGDCIFDNDTFFGLLLPSVAANISKEKNKLIELFEIPVYSETDIKKTKVKSDGFSNTQKDLNNFIKKAKTVYNKSAVIKTPVLRDNHISPASLKESLPNDNSKEDKNYSGENSADIFIEVDKLLLKFSKYEDKESEKFNSGSFGTIAHICVEALLKNEEAVIPSNIAGFLNEKEYDILLKAGKQLAERFIASPLGKLAKTADIRESEFPFRSIIKNSGGEEVFINGIIDLFFSNENCLHIVDFKTDSVEIPAVHTPQLACYYRAVSDLFAKPQNKECSVWLYYLRTGHAVDMTKKVLNYNLEQRAFSY